ncbi:tetratricopeptide repeat protein [Halomonas salifodinae]|uniref:Tetratricopeptide repeat protein n=1 Tax=Halomonas salifodinae TaxID=438745 RepID=A0ABW2ETS8_9GAMM
MMTKFIRPILLMGLLSLASSGWALEPEVQAAKNEGMRLYNIGHSTAAMPYLRQAAEAGDVEAMYYMGEAERRQQMMGLTRAAMEWYLQAAAEGDAYSMLQLFRGGACTAGDRCPEGFEDWHHAALAITQPQAEAGDPDAMLAMYHIQRMFEASRRAGEWLERAAEAGQPEAQTLLGRQILNGRGWYLTNSRRLGAAEEWFRQAAEQGYVPAISEVADVLISQERYEEAWEWMQVASQAGHMDRRFGVGWCYLDPARRERCQGGEDKIKGWAILHAMAMEASNQSAISNMRRNRDILTDEEIVEAEALAEREWIGREPPLSNFPPRFGY